MKKRIAIVLVLVFVMNACKTEKKKEADETSVPEKEVTDKVDDWIYLGYSGTLQKIAEKIIPLLLDFVRFKAGRNIVP